MKDFFHYFFGKGTEVEFRTFSFAHLAPILVLLGVIYLIYHFRDKIRASKHEKLFCYIQAFTMIVCEMSYYWRLATMPELGGNSVDHLPITVCGWGLIFCSYLVLTKSQSLFDITYFWLFSGTIFALITPTVITYTGPTRYRYYQFWTEHCAGYIAIFYMIFVHKMRPNLKSIVKSYVAFAVLAVIAFFANRIIGPGANYLYMARPEDTPSILDILPPNFAVRLLVMATVVSLLYALSYLPWYLMDRKAKLAAEDTDPAAEKSAEETETTPVG